MSRKAGSDRFKKELSRAEKNRRFRESLLTDDAARAKRLEGIEGIEGLDEMLVSQALQGGTFGKEDRARYEALLKERDGEVEPEPAPEPSLPPQGGGGQVTEDVRGGNNSIVSPISQDNDVAIMGDGNNVAQDNSITQTIDSRDQSDNRRYYGGSNRVFNYGNMEDRDSAGSKRFLDNFINKSIFNNTNSNVVDFRDAQFGSFGLGEDNLRDMRVIGN